MSSKGDLVELPGLRVTVDRVAYNPEAQTPPERPHCFVYFITIRNESDHTVTLLGTSQGPRMGSFFALYGIENSRRLIAEALETVAA